MTFLFTLLSLFCSCGILLSFFSSATARATALALNAAKFSIPFGRVKCRSQGWLSREVEEAVSEKRKAFAAAHRSDEDRKVYILTSRQVSSVVAKAKAEA